MHFASLLNCAGMGDDIREKTDALDAAGNTTAAIGKGARPCCHAHEPCLSIIQVEYVSELHAFCQASHDRGGFA